jgi:hypothetical protein
MEPLLGRGDRCAPLWGALGKTTFYERGCLLRAADLSSKSYLETEAEVDEYLAKLKAELLAAIHAGQRARIQ